jgi:hypothetical protein
MTTESHLQISQPFATTTTSKPTSSKETRFDKHQPLVTRHDPPTGQQQQPHSQQRHTKSRQQRQDREYYEQE